MAIKVEISFRVYQAGFRIRSERRSTIINDWREAIDRILGEVEHSYPGVKKAQIIQDLQSKQTGSWIRIIRRQNTTIKLEIDKLR